MDRQARTIDTVQVKSREMTDTKGANTDVMAGGRMDKDDRKQNILVFLCPLINMFPYVIL